MILYDSVFNDLYDSVFSRIFSLCKKPTRVCEAFSDLYIHIHNAILFVPFIFTRHKEIAMTLKN